MRWMLGINEYTKKAEWKIVFHELLYILMKGINVLYYTIVDRKPILRERKNILYRTYETNYFLDLQELWDLLGVRRAEDLAEDLVMRGEHTVELLFLRAITSSMAGVQVIPSTTHKLTNKVHLLRFTHTLQLFYQSFGKALYVNKNISYFTLTVLTEGLFFKRNTSAISNKAEVTQAFVLFDCSYCVARPKWRVKQ